MLAVLCALALLVPVAAADAATASSNKGRVTVGAKITRFAVVDRKIVARGVLTTRVTGARQSQAARTPVTFAVVAQSGRWSVLTLRLQGLDLTLLGLNVNLSEVNLRIYAIRRGEGSGILAGCSARCRAASSGSDAAQASRRLRSRPGSQFAAGRPADAGLPGCCGARGG
jgi:hypothetical protein